MIRFRYLSLAFVLLLVFDGCAYEEGPFSFRSRKKRLANTWEYVKVIENGIDISPTFTSRVVEFETDNEAILTVIDLNGVFTILQGNWECGNHPDRLVISVFDTQTDEFFFIEWIIKRLANDELIVEEFTNGKWIQYELRTLE